MRIEWLTHTTCGGSSRETYTLTHVLYIDVCQTYINTHNISVNARLMDSTG